MLTFRGCIQDVSSILNVEDSLEEWWMWETSIPATGNKCRNAFWNPGLKCKSFFLHLFAFWSSLDSRPIICKISVDIPAWWMTEPFRQQKRRAKHEGDPLSAALPQSQCTLLPGECAVEWGRSSYQCLSGVGQWLVSHTGPQWHAEKMNGYICSFPVSFVGCLIIPLPFRFTMQHLFPHRTPFIYLLVCFSEVSSSTHSPTRIHYAYSVMAYCFKTLWRSSFHLVPECLAQGMVHSAFLVCDY